MSRVLTEARARRYQDDLSAQAAAILLAQERASPKTNDPARRRSELRKSAARW